MTTLLALVGSIGGGVIAEVFGLRVALAVGVLGGAAAVLFVWFSPVRSMRSIPAPGVLPGVRVDDLPQTE